ncbi:HSP20-like chaperone [Penicillium angulare]|uniref:HSP20-like chaperone n=1 Tax=Penicillium angulare TaxID=116970 RepID=A0A9W9GBE8_9EURO|nr:HSP20-like chaperone [Penicillium angulare]
MPLQFHQPLPGLPHVHVPILGDLSQFNPPTMSRALDAVDGSHHRRSAHNPRPRHVVTPRFDVRESADAYHLDGDFPGISQSDISIEFSDAQTMVVKAHVEREHHRATPTANENMPDESAEATTEAGEDPEKKDAKKDTKKALTHRYLATERRVGEFQRPFFFTTRVDQDGVKASLKNGVLSITVPKAKGAGKKIIVE